LSKEPVTSKWGDEKKNEGGLNVYFLYDRSGSMRPKQAEAVPAVNAYIEALSPDTVVTVVAFDDQDKHLLIRDHVLVKDYRPIDVGVVEARGMTPLYDATGWIIDKIFQDNPYRAVLVVQTDGEENHSTQYSWVSINKKIEEMKARNYPVVFLGAEFRNVGVVSGGLGVNLCNTVNITTGNYRGVAAAMATSTQHYGATGQSVSGGTDWFTPEQKAALGDTDTLDPKDKKKANKSA
jgi:Mg-chelatase subunit ChlD